MNEYIPRLDSYMGIQRYIAQPVVIKYGRHHAHTGAGLHYFCDRVSESFYADYRSTGPCQGRHGSLTG